MNIGSIDAILKKTPYKPKSALEQMAESLSAVKQPIAQSGVSKGSLKSAVKKVTAVKPMTPKQISEGQVMPEGFNITAKQMPGTLEGAMAEWDAQNPGAAKTVRDTVKYRLQSFLIDGPKTEAGWRAKRSGSLLASFDADEIEQHRMGANQAYNQASGEAFAEVGSNIDKGIASVIPGESGPARFARGAVQGVASFVNPVDQAAMLYQVSNAVDDPKQFKQLGEGLIRPVTVWFDPKATPEEKGSSVVMLAAMLAPVGIKGIPKLREVIGSMPNEASAAKLYDQVGEMLLKNPETAETGKALIAEKYKWEPAQAVEEAGPVKTGRMRPKWGAELAKAQAELDVIEGKPVPASVLNEYKGTSWADAEIARRASEPDTVKATREHFANIVRKQIDAAKSGKEPVNDLQSFIKDKEQEIADSLSGKYDGSFTFKQYEHYLKTGEEVPLIKDYPTPPAKDVISPVKQARLEPIIPQPKAKGKKPVITETPQIRNKETAINTEVNKPVIQESRTTETAPKQPWEMTWKESKPKYEWTDNAWSKEHLKQVRQAVSEGKPVPDNVLAEYKGTPWADAEIARRANEPVTVKEKPTGKGYAIPEPPTPAIVGEFGKGIAEGFRQTLKDSVIKTGDIPRQERNSSIGRAWKSLIDNGEPANEATLNKALAIAEGKPTPPAKEAMPPVKQAEAPINTEPVKPVEPEPRSTGLANQVQEREAAKGLLKQIEPTKGATVEGVHEATKRFLDGNPEYDYSAYASDIAEGKVPFDYEGAIKANAGKIKLSRDVDAIGKKLDADPANNKLRAEYKQAQDRLDEFAQNIQIGKGSWHDVGMALQEGAYIDDASYANVLQRAKREKYYDPDDKAYHEDVKTLTNELASVNEKLKEAELKASELQRKLEESKKSPKTKDVIEKAQKKRTDAIAELKRMWDSGEFASTQAGAGLGGFSPSYAKAVKLGGDILMSYIEEGAATVVEAIGKTMAHLKEIGVEVSEQDIIDQFASKQKATVPDAQKRIVQLKKELRDLTTQAKEKELKAKGEKKEIASSKERLAMQEVRARIAEIEADIASGVYEKAKPRAAKPQSPEMELLRAKKYALEQAVRAKIRELESPKSVRIATNVAGLVRGTVLGSDVGTVLRQGLFGVTNPKQMVKSLARALDAAKNDGRFNVQMHRLRTREINGKPAMLVEKKAGLQITDTLIKPEEIVVGKLLKRVPWLGKAVGARLERFQVAYINSLRTDLFDRAANLGLKDAELKDVAHFINNITGRGNVEFLPEGVKKTLDIAMTSFRYESSRWGTLAEPGRNLMKLGKKVDGEWVWNKGAIENFKMMGKQAAFGIATIELAKQMGFEIVTDPSSPDFLKMRRGNTVFDFSAGLVPRAKDAIRAGYAVMTGGDFRNNVASIAGKTVVRPISPAVRLPITLGSQAVQAYAMKKKPGDIKDPFSGMDMSDQDMGWRMAIPLVVSSTIDAGQKDGFWTGLGAFTAEFFGGGVSTYPKKVQKQASVASSFPQVEIPRYK